MKRAYVPFAAAALITSLAAASACNNEGAHVYIGRAYDSVRGCLEEDEGIDVLAGEDPGSACAAKCLVAPAEEDGGRTLFVSTMCPPYPPAFETGGAYPECDGALAALARGDRCLADGGSTAPAPDAGSDAPADAPAE